MKKELGLGGYFKRQDHEELKELFIKKSSEVIYEDNKNPIYYGEVVIELMKKIVLKKKGYSNKIKYEGKDIKKLMLIFTELQSAEETKKVIKHKLELKDNDIFEVISMDKSKIIGYSLVR